VPSGHLFLELSCQFIGGDLRAAGGEADSGAHGARDFGRGHASAGEVTRERPSPPADNERDLRRHLQLGDPSPGHNGGTAGAKSEEGGGNDRSVCPESPGLHAHYKDWDNGFLPRKGTAISTALYASLKD
jgi:hypothetical protein